ncbi:hypothetical protein JW960_22975 [candidate division KSB1 bacterium]|nr:hypothetical protein [candidate division KSB1 bacterium]
MGHRRYLCFTWIFLFFVGSAFASVPTSQLQEPAIPFYMQSMNFQTVRMQIFGVHYSGMVDDKYSDLIVNPAYINAITQKYFYIDFASPDQIDIITTPLLSTQPYTDSYFVRPSWYGSTSYNTIDTNPHYNFAMLLPLSNRLKVGIFHRLIFDYGPFLMEQSYTDWAGASRGDSYYNNNENAELKRLEVDDNQQTVKGSQSEIIVGINLTSRLDLGLRLGHYIYRQDGDLYDSKWGYFPHNSFADLNEDDLNVDGNQYESGLGILLHPNDNFTVSAYGGITTGDGDRATAVLDTSHSWSERDTDPRYYSFSHSYMTSRSGSDIDSKKPKFTLSVEWKLKESLKLRSAYSYTKLNNDFSGTIMANDTSNSDQTYDDWDNSSYHFRRVQSEDFSQTSLTSAGEETSEVMSWYISLIYQPDENWTLFGGLHFQKQHYHYEIDEFSTNENGSFTMYSLYNPGTSQSYYFDDKRYTIESNSDRFVCSAPIGLFARVYNGFSLIIGTDIVLSLSEDKSTADLLYSTKHQQKWSNGNLTVDDLEENRLERFNSQEPKIFTRTKNNYFGFVYAHKSGINFYVKTGGDLFTSNTWTFGFELCR